MLYSGCCCGAANANCSLIDGGGPPFYLLDVSNTDFCASGTIHNTWQNGATAGYCDDMVGVEDTRNSTKLIYTLPSSTFLLPYQGLCTWFAEFSIDWKLHSYYECHGVNETPWSPVTLDILRIRLTFNAAQFDNPDRWTLNMWGLNEDEGATAIFCKSITAVPNWDVYPYATFQGNNNWYGFRPKASGESCIAEVPDGLSQYMPSGIAGPSDAASDTVLNLSKFPGYATLTPAYSE